MNRKVHEKSDPLAATHPMAWKCFLLVDKKKSTTELGLGADEHAWLLRTGRVAPDQIRSRA